MEAYIFVYLLIINWKVKLDKLPEKEIYEEEELCFKVLNYGGLYECELETTDHLFLLGMSLIKFGNVVMFGWLGKVQF